MTLIQGNPTKDDLARWKAEYDYIEGKTLGAPNHDYSVIWNLLAAYERVVVENAELKDGVAELQDLEGRLVADRDRLTARVEEVEKERDALLNALQLTREQGQRIGAQAGETVYNNPGGSRIHGS